MTAKLFEVRDRATFLPVLAVLVEPASEQEHYLLRRAGYSGKPGEVYVIMAGLDGGLDKATSDPYDWDNRTRQVAHDFIIKHWDQLTTGAVIDVEWILGEAPFPKASEREDT